MMPEPIIQNHPTVIWDFNGTILDDQPLCQTIINEMLARRGLKQLSREDYLAGFDFPVIDYYRQVGFDFDQEPFEDLAIEYMAQYQPQSLDCPLRPGMMETMEALRSLGAKQVLLSATRQDFLEKQIRHFGIDRYLDQVIGLDNILGSSKIDRAKTWSEAHLPDIHRAVLVGDTTHDFLVADELGCACLLLTGGHNAASRLVATGAQIGKSPGAVLPLVSDWRNT